MTFGEKLQILRKRKGLSQEQLAEQVNVSRQAVSKWEIGESLPDTDKIILLAKFFEVTIDYLLDKETESERINANAENRTGGHNVNNNAIARVSMLIKRKGYIAGYIISFYGVIALGLTRFAYFSFKSMLLPKGFDIVLSDLPTTMKFPLYLANIFSVLALILILFGVGLAFYLKNKKSDI